MAIQKLTDNVQIDFEEKRIYVDFDNATETDNKVAVLNRADGFVILPASDMPKPKREKSKARVANGKKNAHNAEYWKKQLADVQATTEQVKKFEELYKEKCKKGEKGKGYFAAVSYAKGIIAAKKEN